MSELKTYTPRWRNRGDRREKEDTRGTHTADSNAQSCGPSKGRRDRKKQETCTERKPRTHEGGGCMDMPERVCVAMWRRRREELKEVLFTCQRHRHTTTSKEREEGQSPVRCTDTARIAVHALGHFSPQHSKADTNSHRHGGKKKVNQRSD